MFRFGISFNKIFDYLAAGRPILCDFKANYNPVLMGGAGISVDSANVQEIAKKIDELVNMDVDKYNDFCEAARITSQRYDFSKLTNKLIEIFNEVNV